MRIFFYFFLVLLLISCSEPKKIQSAIQENDAGITLRGKLFASLYQQRAAEYRALCLQAYNIARFRLDDILRSAPGSMPRAIITDLDETVFDNSRNEVHQDLQGKGFDPAGWTQWTSMADADTVPGSFSFFKYAASRNVEIFYITNRGEKDRAGTLENLQKFNFPDASNDHLFVRQNTSGKEARRQQVMTGHDVVMLLGDNLSDFSQVFDLRTVDDRSRTVDQLASEFGNRFIVLPNPVYGDWENSVYGYKQLTTAQKDSAIRSQLKAY
jgi:5'-nucleotidase (lipoprotein e(P4) family)